METDINKALEPIRGELSELKDTQKKLLEVLLKFAQLSSEMKYNKEIADTARKVIHKRMDKIETETIKNKDFMIKIIVGVGSVAITSLLGIALGIIKI